MFMFDERLIEATRRREVIYNPANKSNRYVELKEQAWMEIAHELNTPIKKCKARWTSLRDRFRRITKAQQHAHENGIKAHNKWRYYDALSFLADASQPITLNNVGALSIVPEFEVESMFSMDQFQKVDFVTPAPPKARKVEVMDPIKDLNLLKCKEEPQMNGSPEGDATDMFFMSLARRIKTANLSQLTQMKLEAEILNFTISQLEQIQKTGLG